MAIVLNGKKLTEAWLNGKKLKEAWINGHRVFPEHEDKKMIRITTENNAHIPFSVTLKKLYFKPNIVKPINVSMSSTNGEDTKDFDVGEALSDVTIILGEKPIQADWEVTPKFSGIVFI